MACANDETIAVLRGLACVAPVRQFGARRDADYRPFTVRVVVNGL